MITIWESVVGVLHSISDWLSEPGLIAAEGGNFYLIAGIYIVILILTMRLSLPKNFLGVMVLSFFFCIIFVGEVILLLSGLVIFTSAEYT